MSWLDKYQNKILIAIWSSIFLTCLLVIFSEPVNAATSSSLPYTVNENLYLSYDDFISIWETQAKLDGASDSWLSQFHWDDNNVIGFSVLNDGDVLYTYFYIPMDNSSYNMTLSNNYSSFSYDNDYITINFSNYCLFMFITNNNNTSYYNRYYNNNSHNFLGEYSIPLYISSDFYFVDQPVLVLPSYSPVSVTGHSSPPVDDNGHYIDDGTGNRIPKPNFPTITGHSPSQPQFPSIDISSLEKLIESLIDIVKYSTSYIVGVLSDSFSNLLSNISSLFDYVVQSFYFAVNNIVGAIKDLAQTFYDNMVSLFEPLYEFFSGVATFFNNLIQIGMDGDSFSLSTFIYNLLVPDPEDFSQSLIDLDIHHVVPLARIVKTKFVSIFDSFYNLTPTKVFLLPSFTWHGHTYNLTMDFSWYDDYKVYGDTIITGFLVIGYIYWFVLQLNTMFRGGSSIGHDVAKVGGKE